MPISRAEVEVRLAGLRHGLAQLRRELDAQEGAIQECQHWLARLAQEEEAVSPPAPESV